MLKYCVMVAGLFLTLSLQDASTQFSLAPPTTAIVNVTDTLTLECFRPNTTTISWQRDGIPINTSTDGFTLSTLPTGHSFLNISSASVETHNGSYACVAIFQDGGEDIATFDIIVQFIGVPSINKITDPCARGYIYVQSSVTLECILPDSQPPISSVTWFRVHGTEEEEIDASSVDNIMFSSDNNLIISGITSIDTGEYRCGVENDGMLQGNSATIMLTVITSIPERSITLEPSGKTLLAKEGGSTSIKCIIFPPSPPFMATQVGWRRNGVEDIVNGGDITLFSHSCNLTLIIPKTFANHTGTYSCYLGHQESEGITLSLARIPATYRVAITPDVDILGVNRSILFLCLRDPVQQIHNVNESISWQFSNQTSERRDVVVADDRVILGERSLSILSLQVKDSGSYFCVADHMLVASISTEVNLTVEAAPHLYITLSPPVARLNTSFLATCTIVSSRSVEFSWFLNENQLSQSNQIIIITHSLPMQSSVLTIVSVLETDLGKITCTARDILNIHVPVNTSEYIQEDGQLYIIGNQNNRTLNIRNETRLILNCPLRRGSEFTSVQWFNGGRELSDGADGVVFSDDGLTVMSHLVSLSTDDGDQYVCRIRDDGMDVDLLYTITLYITTVGNIIIYPGPVTNATEGSHLRLDCLVTGRPTPQVNWFRRLNMDLQQNVVNGSLIFDRVQQEDEGIYICYIQDPFMKRNTTLRVQKRPPENTSTFTRDESILIYTVVGVVALVLFIICPLLMMTGCYYRLHSTNYKLPTQYSIDGGDISKQSSFSRKENDDGLMIGGPPPNRIFSTLQCSTEFSTDRGYGNSLPSSVVPLETFNVGSTSLLSDSRISSPMHGSLVYPTHDPSSSSLVRGTSSPPLRETSSPPPLRETSSPPLGETMVSSSMFSSEAHTILENGLPNFPRNNVKLRDLMGQGEFGPVMKAVARNLVPGQFEVEVAVKLLVSDCVEEEGFRADLAIVDYANQMKLEFENISSILGICSDKEPYYVIYEYLDRGDLKNFLMGSRPEEGAPPTLMTYDLMKIVAQVSSGMSYLFSQRIIHGDIASRNCLVSAELNIKIGDLGIGHELYADDYHDNGAQLLPIRWMPPELLSPSEEGPSFSLYSDVWSFGVFCWEVFSYARLPYDRYTDEEVLVMIPAGSRLRSPSQDCPPDLYLIMMDCWNELPEGRPQFTKIISQLTAIDIDY